jgi:hypothetical protein
MTPAQHTVYLLSPANCAGKRAAMLMREAAQFDLAVRLRSTGATLGECFTFMSGLYFRGKLAYATRFAAPPEAWSGVEVILPGAGFVPASQVVTIADLKAPARVPVDLENPAYLRPFETAIERLASTLGDTGRAVLLGSIATDKYAQPLLRLLGDRLYFPQEFIGRGDMSRGSLMLRHAESGQPLTYIPLTGATRRGSRPPKLEPRRWK